MAGEKKAVRHITIGDRSFAPGDEIPKEYAEQVNNPKAWEAESDVRTPAQVRGDLVSEEAAKAAEAEAKPRK